MESKDWSGFGYFSPNLEKNKTVSGMFLTPEHLRGHWECSKSTFQHPEQKEECEVVKGD